MPEKLSAGYYLTNFVYFLDFVSERYEGILNVAEKSFFNEFRALSQDAQRLYVRLYSRKGPLFRTDKLSYEDISDIAMAVAELIERGFVDCGTDCSTNDILALCTRVELLHLHKVNKGISGSILTKVELLAALAEFLEDLKCKQLQDQLRFTLIQPRHLDKLRVYRLLFFGNLHQDMTDFVLHELGVTPFESYEIDHEARFFDDRELLEQTLALYDLSELSRKIIDSGEKKMLLTLCESLPDRNPDLGFRYDRIVNRIARQLERYKCFAEAFELYQHSGSVPARERAARLLHKMGFSDAAAEACQEIFSSPWDEAEYEFAVKFMRQILDKDHPLQSTLPRISSRVQTDELALNPKDDYSVESLVCEWAEEQGFSAYHVENDLFPGLFGLAFWDIIFSPVRGAFFNPFQRAPADLFHSRFVDARAGGFADRFACIKDHDRLASTVIKHYRSKHGIANRFVHWKGLSEELLELALSRIPTTNLVLVFERMMSDFRNNLSGFPDLILFSDHTYQLVEVKGPGDRLQMNQQRWFRFFREKNIPAMVVNVSYPLE